MKCWNFLSKKKKKKTKRSIFKKKRKEKEKDKGLSKSTIYGQKDKRNKADNKLWIWVLWFGNVMNTMIINSVFGFGVRRENPIFLIYPDSSLSHPPIFFKIIIRFNYEATSI
jgi:hypothetical protein